MRATFGGTALLPLSREADELATAYLAQKVVPRDYEDDAYHVAVCTVARLDYLVSWNFKHLANVRRESGFNAVAQSRRWRRKTSRLVRDMTPEERIAFFNRRLANGSAPSVAKRARR